MVQCNLTQMKNREMVFNSPSDLRGAKVTEVLWSVNPAMHGEFELLPSKKPSNKAAKAPTVLLSPAAKDTLKLEYKKPEIDVEQLTLKEAKRLYENLKEFFG